MYANLFYKNRSERTTFFLTDPRNRLFISSIRCSNYQMFKPVRLCNGNGMHVGLFIIKTANLSAKMICGNTTNQTRM